MALGTLSDWQTSDLIDYLAAGTWWASLHYSDPRVGSPTAHELAGASYARAQVSMAALSVRVMSSTNDQTWSNLPANTIAYVGLFDASVGGNLRAAMPLDDPVPILEGAPYALAAGDIYIAW